MYDKGSSLLSSSDEESGLCRCRWASSPFPWESSIIGLVFSISGRSCGPLVCDSPTTVLGFRILGCCLGPLSCESSTTTEAFLRERLLSMRRNGLLVDGGLGLFALETFCMSSQICVFWAFSFAFAVASDSSDFWSRSPDSIFSASSLMFKASALSSRERRLWITWTPQSVNTHFALLSLTYAFLLCSRILEVSNLVVRFFEF